MRVKARSQTNQPLRHFCDATNARRKCQENAATVANFRHMGAAKRAIRHDAMREGQ
jgi:hypothetical protein